MKENKFLEFKSDITNTFLKTVSAYANYGDGIILFGVSDDGNYIGLDNLEQKCLDIENKINDTIKPNPDYKLDIDYNNSIIKLSVEEGKHKPYLYKGKAYRRNDTSTIEMDDIELKRLILEGLNLNFESLEYKKELTFSIFAEKVSSILNINLSNDILKTFGLIDSHDKYINVAGLLADSNTFSGIDIIKFGNNINEIIERKTIKNVSLFKQFDEAVLMYKKNYTYELIDDVVRKSVETIPLEAFRESVANALVHRTWDDDTNIRISMFKDKIIINSPGGLKSGISYDEYINGQISRPRNPILANVFFRLKYIEMFGTGILRIKSCYDESITKPIFKVYDNSISIELPLVISKPILTEDEKVIFDNLSMNGGMSSSELVLATGFSKDKILRIIKALTLKGYVRTSGIGKTTKYQI